MVGKIVLAKWPGQWRLCASRQSKLYEVVMHNLLRFLLICSILVTPFLPACGNHSAVRSEKYGNALEVKLACRELADQMLSTLPNNALQGYVAMPVAFVDQRNTNSTSALGRLLGESMFYEFNTRGFPTREYRLSGNIDVVGGRDDLAMLGNTRVNARGPQWSALVIGTYTVDADVTFVNARLVRSSDGLVMRTAQVVLENTPIVSRLGMSDMQLTSIGENSRRSRGTPDGALPIRQGR